ncbi:GH3 auxin-responsive promoter family protein [Lewinella sp. 4G2]|uniref:GH3 family domain-containing protein n=1 Tax=Lewinella sp. 4G2 TaxID=1803372 RepID=UPI0007B48948|nr:GH3 auxin-responsive promoter family protein [Lewinella sp. 4G2]OAV45674.1 hypothetical protein A3850_014760 [Lewinella sp. 4G2]
MLKVVNTLFRTYIGRYRRELQQHYDEPLRLQRKQLADILARHADTAFGQEHDFERLLRHPEEFAERVPIRTYEAHLPYINRVLEGERHVLSADDPDWVATTSGTTGATKYLPLSNRAVRDIHLKGSWMSLACLYEKDPDIQVFSTKNLLIGGSFKGRHPKIDLMQGDISAIIIQSIPRVMRSFYIPDLELATSPGYEEKIARIAEIAAEEPGITVLGGVPTWNLPLYRKILDLAGGDSMVDVWPEARVFKHGGVNFEPYRAQFEALFPREDFIFQEIYNATEGFFGVQDKDELRSMLLLLNTGAYYEFIPWDAYKLDDLTSVPLSGVKLDVTYVMIITTEAGLYRYPMGDLLQFTEVDPYRIKIIGRTQEFVNAFGEDLLRSEAEGAILDACTRHDCSIADFHVAPVYIELGKSGSHHWLVEFEELPASLSSFAESLDLALQEANYNYKAKRSNDFAIHRQELTVVPKGFFRTWLKNRGKQGGQHKVPRLANHRRYLESMLGELGG